LLEKRTGEEREVDNEAACLPLYVSLRLVRNQHSISPVILSLVSHRIHFPTVFRGDDSLPETSFVRRGQEMLLERSLWVRG
jgi:hypothetical protein